MTAVRPPLPGPAVPDPSAEAAMHAANPALRTPLAMPAPARPRPVTPPSPATPAAAARRPNPLWRPLVLGTVLGAHALFLWWISAQRADSPPLQPPVLEVAIITEEPAPPQPPAPPPPKPQPRVETPRPVAKPRPAPAPRPVPVVPAAEAPSALTAPEAAPPAPPVVDSAPAAAPAPPAPPAPPAVVEPRYQAAYLNNQTPYPPLARRLGETGTVLLRVFVSAEGQPEQVELKKSSGSPRLDDGALRAVMKWRFLPARRGETPIAAWVVVPIEFKLEN